MGVPGFYSWLIKRYPLVKHMVDKQELPHIDYLYLDMNGIIYKCVKDDSIIFKSQILPKEMEEIWLEVFNYINMIVNILKPTKMIVMALDGVAPRSKMNNQRARRFKSSRDHKRFMQQLYDFQGESESQENFKNNSISPGTKFMQELNANLDFFIKKKIEEDDYWKSLSVIFTGSDSPGEGEHKIMEFIRANQHQFHPDDSHCLYGADADLIMLSMTLPLKNLCIIREEFVQGSDRVRIIASKKEKQINFEMIFVGILKEYFEIEYCELQPNMKMDYDINRIIADFVFLFFFIGNDFLPRCMAYNIRESSIEDLIRAFKEFLVTSDSYVVSNTKLSIKALALLSHYVAQYEQRFIGEKQEDMENYLQNKIDFQNELESKMKMKVVREREFLNQMKTLYMNEDPGSAKTAFYKSKFAVDPSTETEKFYEILNYYLYGLQFVYEYYFINLPSWQWYYPFYYAPLVSDLSMYLNYLAESKFDLEKIVEGSPSPPFKQLLCILPKESIELLPPAFHKAIQDPQSRLRSPFDFYPDEFEDDPYGSIRSHEFVSLIPFLNLEIVNQVYEEAIKETNEEDLARNKFFPSKLYEFDKEAEDILIQSQFSVIPKVSCQIRVTPVSLRGEVKWRQAAQKPPHTESALLKMPSLRCKEFLVSESVNRRKKSYVVTLNNKESEEEKQKSIKLGSEVFYGYPLEHSGQVEAILTFTSFEYTKDFDGLSYYLDDYGRDYADPKIVKARCKEVFDYASTTIMKKEQNQINWRNTKCLVFLKDTMQFVRCLDGSFTRVFSSDKHTTYSIVPAELISSNRTYENTPDNIHFRSIEEEFHMGEDVVVFPDGKHDRQRQALKGKVVGYSNRRVKVQVGEKIKAIDDKTLSNFVHTRELYFNLNLAAFLVETRSSILLTLLDSISIVLGRSDLPPSIDIGLNYISRQEKKLVANLVRINFEGVPSDISEQKVFNYIEISLRGLELILEYKRKFPEILKFIEERHEKLVENREDGRINWREPILLKNLYHEKEEDKQVKALMSVYLWLIKKEETHMPLSSVYSKQVSTRNIQKLQEYFSKCEADKKKSKKYEDPKIIEVDPNFMMSRRLAGLGKMFLAKAPKISTIRDQVICLKADHFGDFGVIIGFDGDKYEVLFRKPSFGKTNLNGICGELWGGKFSERQLFNFDTWPSQFIERPPAGKKLKLIENLGWVNSKAMSENVPKYKEKSISTLADLERLAEKGLIPEGVAEHAAKVRKNQKVEKIDEDYVVVDTRSHAYEHKYDKGKTYIPKEYVQKIEKDKKYMEKPIEDIAGKELVVEEYQKELIVNKAATKGEKEQEKEDEKEEDGDEMFA